MLKRIRRHTLRGIALIEALVGLLIFTTGIIGIAGMQAAMSRAQGTAKSRADAALLASELIGISRVELANAPGSKLASYATDCTSSCAQWLAKVAQVLPNGGATLAADTDSGVMTITVTWTAPAEEPHRYVTSTSIR